MGPSRCAIGIIDLRCIPGTESRVDNTNAPYFKEFLDTYMDTVSDPSLKNPHVWLWITENVDRQCQAIVYANKIKDEYAHKASYYMPCSNERLNGIPEGKVLEKHMVPLLFLVKKGSNMGDILDRIPPTFYAPDLPLYSKAGMYREHDFGVRMTELHLEFYCRVLKMFSFPNDKFLSLMAGSKPMLAGIVRSAAPLFAIVCLARLELNLHPNVDVNSCHICVPRSCSSAFD
jgi:hypothetical protein